MLQALTTPLLGSVVVGGLVLALGAYRAGSAAEDPQIRRLVLHTTSEPNAVYLTAWHEGDVHVAMKDGELQPLTFKMRATVNDGCRWLGIERLEPIDKNTYAYEYSEVILSCRPNAVPCRKTPRTGLVTVE